MAGSRFVGNADFNAALEQIAGDAILGDGRFPARNFLLECEIPEDRVDGYLSRPTVTLGGTQSLERLHGFNSHHNLYLNQAVNVGTRSHGIGGKASPCPESFEDDYLTKLYTGVGGEINLVRVENIRFIADYALWDVEDAAISLKEIAQANRTGVRLSTSREKTVRALLDTWQDVIDARPMFATFWENVYDAVEWDHPDWAETLRDRLGLAGYDATARGRFEVVVFKYPVTIVPTRSTGDRLLLRPTVLDSALNEAFYTNEPESGVGVAMDLAIRDDDPWQEVIHPAVYFRPSDVWAVGSIASGLPTEVRAARAHHMLKVAVRSADEFAELCESIDGDI